MGEEKWLSFLDKVNIRLGIEANFWAISNLWFYCKETVQNVYLKVDNIEVIVLVYY